MDSPESSALRAVGARRGRDRCSGARRTPRPLLAALFLLFSLALLADSGTVAAASAPTVAHATVSAVAGLLPPLAVAVWAVLPSGVLAAAPPTVTAAQAASPVGGQTVTIQGTEFGDAVSTTVDSVTVGGSACTSPTILSDTELTCEVPAGVGVDLPVIVSINGTASAAANVYSYLGPVVTAIDPVSGPTVGTGTLTVYGANFGAVACTQNVDPCPVKAHACGADIEYNAGCTAAPAPSADTGVGIDSTRLSDVGPARTVQIIASNGAFPCASVEHWTDRALTCTMPSGAAGLNVNVSVTLDTQVGYTPSYFNFDAPNVVSITPAAGVTDGAYTVTIGGSNFGPAGSATVSVGGTVCGAPAHTTDAQITCAMPEGEGLLVDVTVNAIDQQGTGNDLFSYAAPDITDASPTTGATGGGTVVDLLGTSFGSAAATMAITVGTTACTAVSRVSHTQVQCTTPAGVGTGAIAMTVNTQPSTGSESFVYTGPSVTSLDPTNGPAAGTYTVTLNGNNFGPLGTPATISVGGSACTSPSVLGHAQATCVMIPGNGPAKAMEITIGGVTSSGGPQWSYNPPDISSITPATYPASAGGTVTLSGVNFGGLGDGRTITFGTYTCPESVYTSDAQTTCLLPPGIGGGLNVTLGVTAGATDSGSSGAFLFSYAAPTIGSVAPLTLAVDGSTTVLTLTGTNFGPETFAAIVTVDGVPCTSTQISSDTSLTCTPPLGNGASVPIVVTLGDQPSNVDTSVSYVAFTLTSFAPTFGQTFNDPPPGGYHITLTGNNFGLAETLDVTVGGTPCLGVDVVSITEIHCWVPLGAGAGHSVSVSATNEGPVAFGTLFSYTAPSINLVEPFQGPKAGGTLVTIKGDNFGGVSTPVTVEFFDGSSTDACDSPTWVSHTAITCTTRSNFGTFSGGAINVDVTVDVAGQVSPIPATKLYSYVDITSSECYSENEYSGGIAQKELLGLEYFPNLIRHNVQPFFQSDGSTIGVNNPPDLGDQDRCCESGGECGIHFMPAASANTSTVITVEVDLGAPAFINNIVTAWFFPCDNEPSPKFTIEYDKDPGPLEDWTFLLDHVTNYNAQPCGTIAGSTGPVSVCTDFFNSLGTDLTDQVRITFDNQALYPHGGWMHEFEVHGLFRDDPYQLKADLSSPASVPSIEYTPFSFDVETLNFAGDDAFTDSTTEMCGVRLYSVATGERLDIFQSNGAPLPNDGNITVGGGHFTYTDIAIERPVIGDYEFEFFSPGLKSVRVTVSVVLGPAAGISVADVDGTPNPSMAPTALNDFLVVVVDAGGNVLCLPPGYCGGATHGTVSTTCPDIWCVPTTAATITDGRIVISGATFDKPPSGTHELEFVWNDPGVPASANANVDVLVIPGPPFSVNITVDSVEVRSAYNSIIPPVPFELLDVAGEKTSAPTSTQFTWAAATGGDWPVSGTASQVISVGATDSPQVTNMRYASPVAGAYEISLTGDGAPWGGLALVPDEVTVVVVPGDAVSAKPRSAILPSFPSASPTTVLDVIYLETYDAGGNKLLADDTGTRVCQPTVNATTGAPHFMPDALTEGLVDAPSVGMGINTGTLTYSSPNIGIKLPLVGSIFLFADCAGLEADALEITIVPGTGYRLALEWQSPEVHTTADLVRVKPIVLIVLDEAGNFVGAGDGTRTIVAPPANTSLEIQGTTSWTMVGANMTVTGLDMVLPPPGPQPIEFGSAGLISVTIFVPIDDDGAVALETIAGSGQQHASLAVVTLAPLWFMTTDAVLVETNNTRGDVLVNITTDDPFMTIGGNYTAVLVNNTSRVRVTGVQLIAPYAGIHFIYATAIGYRRAVFNVTIVAGEVARVGLEDRIAVLSLKLRSAAPLQVPPLSFVAVDPTLNVAFSTQPLDVSLQSLTPGAEFEGTLRKLSTNDILGSENHCWDITVAPPVEINATVHFPDWELNAATKFCNTSYTLDQSRANFTDLTIDKPRVGTKLFRVIGNAVAGFPAIGDSTFTLEIIPGKPHRLAVEQLWPLMSDDRTYWANQPGLPPYVLVYTQDVANNIAINTGDVEFDGRAIQPSLSAAGKKLTKLQGTNTVGLVGGMANFTLPYFTNPPAGTYLVSFGGSGLVPAQVLFEVVPGVATRVGLSVSFNETIPTANPLNLGPFTIDTYDTSGNPLGVTDSENRTVTVDLVWTNAWNMSLGVNVSGRALTDVFPEPVSFYMNNGSLYIDPLDMIGPPVGSYIFEVLTDGLPPHTFMVNVTYGAPDQLFWIVPPILPSVFLTQLEHRVGTVDVGVVDAAGQIVPITNQMRLNVKMENETTAIYGQQLSRDGTGASVLRFSELGLKGPSHGFHRLLVECEMADLTIVRPVKYEFTVLPGNPVRFRMRSGGLTRTVAADVEVQVGTPYQLNLQDASGQEFDDPATVPRGTATVTGMLFDEGVIAAANMTLLEFIANGTHFLSDVQVFNNVGKLNFEFLVITFPDLYFYRPRVGVYDFVFRGEPDGSAEEFDPLLTVLTVTKGRPHHFFFVQEPPVAHNQEVDDGLLNPAPILDVRDPLDNQILDMGNTFLQVFVTTEPEGTLQLQQGATFNEESGQILVLARFTGVRGQRYEMKFEASNNVVENPAYFNVTIDGCEQSKPNSVLVTTSAGNGTEVEQSCLCREGYFEDDSSGELVCEICEVGSFSDELGASACKVCESDVSPFLSTSGKRGASSRFDCKCIAGYYYAPRYDPSVNPNRTGDAWCNVCEEGGFCPGGDVILVEPGYWRPNPNSAEIFQCRNAAACLGDDPSGNTTVYGKCATGYEGPLCGVCDDRHGKFGETCTRCPGDTLAILSLVGTVIFLIGHVVLVIRSATRDRSSVTVIQRILLNYLQVMGLIGGFQVEWPPVLQGFFSAGGGASSVSVRNISVDCSLGFNHYELFLIQVLFPVFMTAAVWMFNFAELGVRKLISAAKKETNLASAGDAATSSIVASIVVIFMTHSSVTLEVFNMFNCEELGEAGRFLSVNLEISCEDALYKAWRRIAFVILTSFCVGVPVYGILLLTTIRRKLSNPAIVLKFGYLYVGLNHDTFFWEMLIMARKLSLVACAVFLRFDVELQAYGALWVIQASVMSHLFMMPYHDPLCQNLEFGSLLATTVTVMASIMFYKPNLPLAATISASAAAMGTNGLALGALLFFFIRGKIRKIFGSQSKEVTDDDLNEVATKIFADGDQRGQIINAFHAKDVEMREIADKLFGDDQAEARDDMFRWLNDEDADVGVVADSLFDDEYDREAFRQLDISDVAQADTFGQSGGERVERERKAAHPDLQQ